jgi:hypothetical protein
MSQNRNSHDFSLSYDQRLLLQLYIDFYNHTTRQMDSLHDLQNEIRGNINQIVGLSTMHHTRNTTQNSSIPRSTFRQNNHTQNYNNTHNHNNSARTANEQRRRRNHMETTNDRYTYYGSIPYLVPVDNVPMTGLDGRIPRGVLRPTGDNSYDSTFFANFLRTFYDRIQVAPTRQQIEAATRIVSFSEIENPLNNSCPVTLDRFENTSSVTQIIPCGHIFSPSGIDNWLQSNVRCPVCRYDIRDYNVNSRRPSASSEPIIEEAPEEETKEEGPLEESKNDSDESNQERNSIPNRHNNINPNRATFTSSDIQNTLSSLTENILGQILNPPSNSSTNSPMRNFVFDSSFNSLMYDASNNQFIFEGFLRR